MRALRARLPHHERRACSTSIAEKVFAHKAFREAKMLGAYRAIDGEIDPLHIVSRAVHDGKEVCFPSVETNTTMGFRMPDGWRESAYGVQPVGRLVSPENLDLILVPGIAFTDEGDRVGFGGGFYDRYLSTFSGASIGLGYAFQRCDTLDTEPWDIRLDYVLFSDG